MNGLMRMNWYDILGRVGICKEDMNDEQENHSSILFNDNV